MGAYPQVGLRLHRRFRKFKTQTGDCFLPGRREALGSFDARALAANVPTHALRAATHRANVTFSPDGELNFEHDILLQVTSFVDKAIAGGLYPVYEVRQADHGHADRNPIGNVAGVQGLEDNCGHLGLADVAEALLRVGVLRRFELFHLQDRHSRSKCCIAVGEHRDQGVDLL